MDIYVNVKLRKILLAVFSLVLIASVGLNIYQYSEVSKKKLDDYNTSKKYMSNHEAAFYNALNITGNKPLLEYIKNPNNLSNVIEGIEQSEDYYREATDVVEYYGVKTGGDDTVLLIQQYVNSLKAYQTSIANKDPTSYKDNIYQVVNDLETISNWLIQKYNTHDFNVYTDNDFYNNVYKSLSSIVKKRSFYASR